MTCRCKRVAILALTATLIIFSSQAIFAIDGVVLISQASAMAGGISGSCDTPGFPVTICQPGSYRFSGNLTVPDANTTAIEISASNVTIDLNGFGINGPADCSSSPCSNTGNGNGIQNARPVTLLSDLTIRNGSIRGMGLDGIRITADGYVIEDMHIRNNGGNGISVGPISFISLGSGLIRKSTVEINGQDGISVGTFVSVDDTIVAKNHGIGLELEAGFVSRNTVTDNGSKALNSSLASKVGYSESYFSGNGVDVPFATNLGQNICGNTTCP